MIDATLQKLAASKEVKSLKQECFIAIPERILDSVIQYILLLII